MKSAEVSTTVASVSWVYTFRTCDNKNPTTLPLDITNSHIPMKCINYREMGVEFHVTTSIFLHDPEFPVCVWKNVRSVCLPTPRWVTEGDTVLHTVAIDFLRYLRRKIIPLRKYKPESYFCFRIIWAFLISSGCKKPKYPKTGPFGEIKNNRGKSLILPKNQ